MLRYSMRLAAAQSWAVALLLSRQVITGQIRGHKQLIYLLLIAVKIKVSKHLLRLFLVPLNVSQLLQRLFPLRSGFRPISLPFSVISRRKKSSTPSAMLTSLLSSPHSNPSPQHLEINHPFLFLAISTLSRLFLTPLLLRQLI